MWLDKLPSRSRTAILWAVGFFLAAQLTLVVAIERWRPDGQSSPLERSGCLGPPCAKVVVASVSQVARHLPRFLLFQPLLPAESIRGFMAGAGEDHSSDFLADLPHALRLAAVPGQGGDPRAAEEMVTTDPG